MFDKNKTWFQLKLSAYSKLNRGNCGQVYIQTVFNAHKSFKDELLNKHKACGKENQNISLFDMSLERYQQHVCSNLRRS